MKRAALLAALVTLLVLLAWPDAHAENLGSDPFGDLTGGKGLMGRYPLGAYALDTHIDSSINPASWGEEAEGLITNVIWTITRLWNALIFWLVETAYNLDLLAADGPLQPIAKAIRSINDHVLGEPWMIAAIAAAGLWAIKKGIVERKHSETAGSLAVSVLLVIAVMFVVFRPVQTVGQAASWSNQISQGVLVGTNAGSLADPQQAKQHILDSMFRAVQLEPWAQLNFGGLSHCVDGTDRNKDGYPKPVDCDSPKRTARRDHMKVVGGVGGYAPRFLAQPPGSDERKAEFEALRDGESPDVECKRGAGCKYVDQFTGYHVDKSDSPAVDIQQSGSADDRLGMAAVIAVVSLAFGILFGGLAILIMLVQVAALLILALSPVILLAAVMPGPGHALAIGWGKKLLLLVLVFKPVFAFVMAMLIVIHTGLAPSTSGMGWLPAYALIGAFYGLVIWKHKWVGEKMQVARSSDTSKVERTVHEKTVQAGAFVAAPLAATWGAVAGRDRQESAVGGKQQEHVKDPQTVETALSGSPNGAAPPSDKAPGGLSTPQTASASSAASPRPPATDTAADTKPPEPAPAAASGVDTQPDRNQPTIPASAEVKAAEREFPGVNTPESVVSPQRRAEKVEVEGLPALPVEQERAPVVEDLAPPPEYKGA